MAKKDLIFSLLLWIIFVKILVCSCEEDVNKTDDFEQNKTDDFEQNKTDDFEQNKTDDFEGRFLWFKPNSNDDDSISTFELMKGHLEKLEDQIDDLEENVMQKCDSDHCDELKHFGEELGDELGLNGHNIYQLFSILQTIIQKLDPCKRSFPHYEMEHYNNKKKHSRYTRDTTAFSDLDENFFEILGIADESITPKYSRVNMNRDDTVEDEESHESHEHPIIGFWPQLALPYLPPAVKTPSHSHDHQCVSSLIKPCCHK